MDETLICVICGAEGRVVLDHDHTTGGVRGWICHRCNVMLGYAADDQTRLTNAAAYLARAEERPRRLKGADGMPAPKRSRAAYMREYRAKNRAPVRTDFGSEAAELRRQVRELEEEVRHLKAELARRTTPARERSFGQSRPAPKPGQRPL